VAWPLDAATLSVDGWSVSVDRRSIVRLTAPDAARRRSRQQDRGGGGGGGGAARDRVLGSVDVDHGRDAVRGLGAAEIV